MEEYIKFTIEQIRKGKDGNGFFHLMETENEAIPILIEAYHHERKLGLRLELIEAIWQHRSANTLEFLEQVLQDYTGEIWQEALDGIVATGREAGIEVLNKEKLRLLALPKVPEERIEWIEEAIDQITELLADQENNGEDES